ncbi:MAG TPA: hypothetical protein VK783_02125, partial [Bacteroidia bacterium]|nr:hypothetical protein [Bacteroidia bacterium]
METEKPLEKVTAEEFIKRLNIAGKRGHAFVNNLHVHQQPVWLTDENIEFNGTIQIIDCEFVTSLIFSSLSKA